jgi:molybdopterin-containing oxidoreductase family iron-sulfur binding subunit
MNDRKELSGELAALQHKLGQASGKRYWRSLEELADTEAFQELMRREFPEQADVWPQALSRRRFLALMGASLTLAGVSGCAVRPAPETDIVPYVRAPEESIPGKPLFFATAMTLAGAGVGLLVESHLGRPTKIEGNPDHPASRGATDPFHQASILTLYDPDRSQTVTYQGQPRTWDDARTALGKAMRQQRSRRGAGLRLLTETVVSPTLAQQLEDLLSELPEARWHQYEPAGREMAYRGSQLAFGRAVHCYYDFQKADVILALDADFLNCGPGNLRYVADFSARRRLWDKGNDRAKAAMNRLYVVETNVTPTGAKADHRLALPIAQIEGLIRTIAARLGVEAAGRGDFPEHAKWISTIATNLETHRGRCLVLAGDRQPPLVHLLVHVLNERLGNVGHTVLHTEPVEARPIDQTRSLQELTKAIEADAVDLLVVMGANPAFTAPADLRFAELLKKKEQLLRVHLGLYQDETARLCQWHLPEAFYLEGWSDTRAYEGTASIVQPLIEPLYQGRSAHELLAVLLHNQETPGRELVRARWRKHWQQQGSSGSFEDFWQTSLHDGVIAGTQFVPKPVPLTAGWERHLQVPAGGASGAGQDFELALQTDPTIYDGRFANNGWLQELPKPLTTLTWDNAALMSPATARELGVGLGAYEHGGEHGGYRVDVIEVAIQGRKVRAPVWIVPGHAERSITLSLGYGRVAAGRVGGSADAQVGCNAYALRTTDHLWFASGLTVVKTGDQYSLACTQQHQLMENRDLVRTGTLTQYRQDVPFSAHSEKKKEHANPGDGRKPLTLYEPFDYSPPKNKWGMVIDLTACTGCKACVVACQAENNIPVVGKEQVLAGREMHWLRIDRYSTGTYEKPEYFYFQPIPCMQCENAPCEYVCPVGATVHSDEGLNDMVYQRCVGTRFCSNNCPYKVRRFNFFHYADYVTPSIRQQYNPDVTVRSRGVMEKCTYCVQRIRHAEIEAQVEGRPILKDEVLTACQAACPAQAVLFGDLNQPASKVKHARESPLHYALLADLNTEPRTTYLAAVRNPHPDLETP